MRSVYAINLCDAGDIFREQNVYLKYIDQFDA